MNRRLEYTESQKADRAELEALAEEVKTLAQDGKATYEKISQIQVQNATITQQVGRVVSDIESEKRTRAETTRDLKEEMRRNKNELSQEIRALVAHGRRKEDKENRE